MGARAALTLALFALAPAGAQAADSFDVYVNPTGTRGYVRLRVIAQSGVAGARVFERVHGRLRPLGPVALDGAEAPAPGLVSGRVRAPWRGAATGSCERWSSGRRRPTGTSSPRPRPGGRRRARAGWRWARRASRDRDGRCA